jgi:hypothetical protein
VQAPASHLVDIDDEAVDAVTLRSVPIYEPEQGHHLRRVLPGTPSRWSAVAVGEPINRFSKFFGGYDFGPVAELAATVRKIYEAIQPAESYPMRNFGDRDLFELAQQAGFDEVYLSAVKR